MKSNEDVHEGSQEAERLCALLMQKDLDCPFDFLVPFYAAGLDGCDPKLREKLSDILEELKSCRHIRAYDYTAMSHWIFR